METVSASTKIICPRCSKSYNFRSYCTHLVRAHNFERTSAKKEKINLFVSEKVQREICDSYLDGYCYQDLVEKFSLNATLIFLILELHKISKRTASQCKKTQQYKTKIESSLLELYGVDNISKHEGIKKQKIETMMKNHGYRSPASQKHVQEKIRIAHNSKSEDEKQLIQKKMQLTFTERYGEGITNAGQLPHARKISSEGNKKRYEDFINGKGNVPCSIYFAKLKFSSSIEKKIQATLSSLGIEFQHNLFKAKKNIDIFIPSLNAVIEVQGDFWHANPLKFKKEDVLFKADGKRKQTTAGDIWDKDRKKKEAILDAGFKLIYIWEYEIKKCKSSLELEKLVADKLQLKYDQ